MASCGERALHLTCLKLSHHIPEEMPFFLIALCMSASKWVFDELWDVRRRVAMLVRRAGRTRTIGLCAACLRIGHFTNHYNFCGNCRPKYFPEVRRRFLTRTLKMPQQLVAHLPRRPGTMQYAASLASVWDMYVDCEEEGKTLGRAWRRRMAQFDRFEDFCEFCRRVGGVWDWWEKRHRRAQ